MEPVQPQPFSFDTEVQESLTVLRLKGELDMAAAPALSDALHRLQHEGAHEIVVDLRELCFLDSMGLSALMEAHGAGQDGHRTVSFIAGGRTVQRVFQITKMDERVSWVDPGSLDPAGSV
jgi:anti-sigma B factor antagonist/stage II sporulation protein AA (anti-sigma F factor antagonist)